MAESTFTNFFNNSRSFGMNVKVPEQTLKLAGKTLTNTAGGVLEPLFTYLEENENVFSGDINKEIQRITANSFNTGMRLQEADAQVNGRRPSFDAKF